MLSSLQNLDLVTHPDPTGLAAQRNHLHAQARVVLHPRVHASVGCHRRVRLVAVGDSCNRIDVGKLAPRCPAGDVIFAGSDAYHRPLVFRKGCGAGDCNVLSALRLEWNGQDTHCICSHGTVEHPILQMNPANAKPHHGRSPDSTDGADTARSEPLPSMLVPPSIWRTYSVRKPDHRLIAHLFRFGRTTEDFSHFLDVGPEQR